MCIILLLFLLSVSSSLRFSPEPKPHSLNGWSVSSTAVDATTVLPIQIALAFPSEAPFAVGTVSGARGGLPAGCRSPPINRA